MPEEKKKLGRPRKSNKLAEQRANARVTRKDINEIEAALARQKEVFEWALRNLEDQKLPARVKALEARLNTNLVETAQAPLPPPSPTGQGQSDEGIAMFFPPAPAREMAKWQQRDRLLLALHVQAVPLDATNIEAFLQLTPTQQSILINGTLELSPREDMG
jgi:hypothetical protein